jgi:hypothetical protein
MATGMAVFSKASIFLSWAIFGITLGHLEEVTNTSRRRARSLTL